MPHAFLHRLRRLLVPAMAAASAVACGKARDRDDVITGFAGTRWGATRQEIQAARGAPDTVRLFAEGVQALRYLEGDMFTARVQSDFFVHPEHGMFRAGYIAVPEVPAQCERVYGLMEGAVQQKFPNLEPEARHGKHSGQPFCAALLARQATRMTRWRDPAGTVIELLAAPGSSEILLTFSTVQANEWEKRKNSGRL